MRSRILELARKGLSEQELAQTVNRDINYIRASLSQLRKKGLLSPKPPSRLPSVATVQPPVLAKGEEAVLDEDAVGQGMETRLGTFDLLTGRVTLTTDVSIETLLFWQALREQKGNDDPFGVFLDSLSRYVRQDLGFDLVFPADRDLTALVRSAVHDAQGDDPGWDVPVSIRAHPGHIHGNGNDGEREAEGEREKPLAHVTLPVEESGTAGGDPPIVAEPEDTEEEDINEYSGDPGEGPVPEGTASPGVINGTRIAGGPGIEGEEGGESGRGQDETAGPDTGGRAHHPRSGAKKAGGRNLRVRRS
jgi:transposase